MKKLVITAAIALTGICCATQASAQLPYSFAKLSQTYTALTGATSASKNCLWTSDTTFVIPIGFNVNIAGKTTDKLYVSGANFISADPTASKMSGFMISGTGLMDRGANIMTAKSDIRYQSSGANGSRILKMEIFNAGLESEYFNTGELKDSMSLQLWVFENTNVVEFHYGPSRVTDFSNCFGSKMMVGFLLNADTSTGGFEKFYVANGSPAAPSLDSLTSFINIKGLSSVPATGTVFRFTPKSSTTGVEHVTAGTLARVYPTVSTGMLHIDNNMAHPLSYTLTSGEGKLVSKGNATTGGNILDVSGIAQGTYILRLEDAADLITEAQKIIRL